MKAVPLRDVQGKPNSQLLSIDRPDRRSELLKFDLEATPFPVQMIRPCDVNPAVFLVCADKEIPYDPADSLASEELYSRDNSTELRYELSVDAQGELTAAFAAKTVSRRAFITQPPCQLVYICQIGEHFDGHHISDSSGIKFGQLWDELVKVHRLTGHAELRIVVPSYAHFLTHELEVKLRKAGYMWVSKQGTVDSGGDMLRQRLVVKAAADLVSIAGG
jgi:hypothetical protein